MIKCYKVKYRITPASGESMKCEMFATAETELEAVECVKEALAKEREKAGYFCGMSDKEISVNYPDGNLCEVYSEFSASESKGAGFP